MSYRIGALFAAAFAMFGGSAAKATTIVQYSFVLPAGGGTSPANWTLANVASLVMRRR